MSDGREGGDDERDDAERPAGGGLLGGLRSLLAALADAEGDGPDRVSRSRRRSGSRFTTEFGFTGRLGRPSGHPDAGADSRSDGSSISGRSSPHDRADENHHVDVRHDDDGRLVVVADMPGVDPDDLRVGLDEDANELVVGVDDQPVERLPLPWPVDDVEGRYNHGVLELRITAAEDAT